MTDDAYKQAYRDCMKSRGLATPGVASGRFAVDGGAGDGDWRWLLQIALVLGTEAREALLADAIGEPDVPAAP